MRREWILLLLFWALHLILVGQSISKQDALKDLRYLEQAVRDGHPSNYQPERQVDLSVVITEVMALPGDSIRNFEFRLWVGKALQRVGCIHTSVRKEPQAYSPADTAYFPFQLALMANGKMLVAAPNDSPLIGEEILTVNGIEADELFRKLTSYRSADGNSRVYPRGVVGYLAPRLLARYFDYPALYKIETNKHNTSLAAVDQEVRYTGYKFLFESSYNGAQFTFGIQDSIGLLRVSQFVKDDRTEFKRLFKQVAEEQNCKALIIDLRGNGGGNRKTAVVLTQELIDEPFAYSIVKPKLKSGKYLTGKGKFFLLLGKMKYGIGGFYRGKKTKYGRAYRFGYPAGKRAFSGKLIVLTDGFTASASTMVTTWLKQHREVTFVGEQAGGGYNGNNGGIFPMLTLPNSEMEVRFPTYRLVLDEESDQRDGIVPDHVIVPTEESIRTGEDRVLSYAMELLGVR